MMNCVVQVWKTSKTLPGLGEAKWANCRLRHIAINYWCEKWRVAWGLNILWLDYHGVKCEQLNFSQIFIFSFLQNEILILLYFS